MFRKVNKIKRMIAFFSSFLRAFALGQLWRKFLYGKNYIRVINYHDTPAVDKTNLEKQFKFLRDHYEPVTEKDLEQFLKSGKWTKSRPGLVLSFDDGLYSNYQYAAPLLDKYGLTGWFFVPTGLISSEKSSSVELAKKGTVQFNLPDPDVPLFMSWKDLNHLKEKHVIGSHTVNHIRLSNNLDDSQLKYEILSSKKVLEEKLACEVSSFCWVGGEESSYSRRGAQFIKEAGYQFSFMTNSQVVRFKKTDPLKIQRTNIESHWSLSLLKFQLSGLMDVKYFFKRKRVNQVTNV